jgi:hypothetical protein
MACYRDSIIFFVLYSLCVTCFAFVSFVCRVLFELGVILCDVYYLCYVLV